jgi:hypothetical protein
MTREELFAGLAMVISVIRYAIYFYTIYKGETRPHLFSWLGFGLAVALATLAQMKLGGGPSVWVLATVSATCFVITIVAFFVGEKQITRADWVALGGVFVSLALWQFSGNPVLAIIGLIMTDLCSYYPTARKSWDKPWDEPPASYLWASARYFFSIFAIPQATVSNVAYIFFAMVLDAGMSALLYWRRRAVPRPVRGRKSGVHPEGV